MKRITAVFAIAYVCMMAAVIVIGPLGYPGYNSLSRHISELGAYGAPDAAIVNAVFVGSSVLLIGFWLLCLKVMPLSAGRAVGFLLLAANGAGLLGAGLFPCEFECARDTPSATQLLHDLFAGLGYLSGVVGLFFLALGVRRLAGWSALFPLLITCAVVAVLSFVLISPDFVWHGAAQRVLETVHMIVMVTIAIRLLQTD